MLCKSAKMQQQVTTTLFWCLRVCGLLLNHGAFVCCRLSVGDSAPGAAGAVWCFGAGMPSGDCALPEPLSAGHRAQPGVPWTIKTNPCASGLPLVQVNSIGVHLPLVKPTTQAGRQLDDTVRQVRGFKLLSSRNRFKAMSRFYATSYI